jgi:hypothetical protein
MSLGLNDALGWFNWLRLLWVDGGYSGKDFANPRSVNARGGVFIRFIIPKGKFQKTGFMSKFNCI